MALVIFMGVLIVVGLGLLAYGVYREMGTEPPVAQTAAASPTAPALAPPLGNAETATGSAPFSAALGLPAGSTVKAVAEAAGRLAVTVTLPGGEERILLLDPSNGNLLGTIAVGPAK